MPSWRYAVVTACSLPASRSSHSCQHLRRGARCQQAGDDVDEEAGAQPVVDRLVGKHVAHDEHGAEGDDGAHPHRPQRTGPGCALPEESAEDRHQQTADQDVVSDGQRRDDIVEQRGDHDDHDAQHHDVQAVGVHVALGVLGFGAAFRTPSAATVSRQSSPLSRWRSARPTPWTSSPRPPRRARCR